MIQKCQEKQYQNDPMTTKKIFKGKFAQMINLYSPKNKKINIQASGNLENRSSNSSLKGYSKNRFKESDNDPE